VIEYLPVTYGKISSRHWELNLDSVVHTIPRLMDSLKGLISVWRIT
jgi:hypothetical protein